jgi:hypothetical protein
MLLDLKHLISAALEFLLQWPNLSRESVRRLDGTGWLDVWRRLLFQGQQRHDANFFRHS